MARAVLRSQADDRLVALSREGREAAFEEIVRRYRPGLVAFAAAYAPPDRAEDVVQESLLSSWRALRESTGSLHLKAWLYAIVRNRGLNARRDARAHAVLDDEHAVAATAPEIALTNDELRRVLSAIAALPGAQHQALIRSALEGRTHEQIATELGATPGAVRQLIYRGRAAVRAGVGLIIPVPVVRALLELASGAAAGGAAAAGGVAAGGGAAAAGGASLLSKGAVAAIVGAIVAGSGVAIERLLRADRDRAGDHRARIQANAPDRASDGPAGQAAAARGPALPVEPRAEPSGRSGGNDGPRGGADDADDDGDDRDDDGDLRDGDDRPEAERDEDRDDTDSDDDSGSSDDRRGIRRGSSGSGHGHSGPSDRDDSPEADDDDNGSDRSGSSSEGGSGGESDPDEPEAEPVEQPDKDEADDSGTGSADESSGSGEDDDGDAIEAEDD